MRFSRFFETILQDVGYAVRGLRRNPALTLAAVAACATGIGAATSVFSVVDRVLFRSLPYADSERLVSVGIVAPLISTQDWLFSSTYQEWRAAPKPFETFTSWAGASDCDLGGPEPARLVCARVESTFLPALGIQPLLGRNFTAEEDRPGGNSVALISHGLWRGRLGGDRGVLGRTLTLDGVATTIVGVLPPEFELPDLSPADAVLPQALKSGAERMRLVRAVGRLKPGATTESAAAALEPLFARFAESIPRDLGKATKFRLRVRTLREQQTEDSRRASWILFGAVLSVLLIACANVANLLLARSGALRRELAVRGALGAGRPRLIRQRLAESLLLGLAGGAAGCVVAEVLLRGFVAIAPQGIVRLQQASLDLRVLGFACGLSLLSGLLFGIAPALETPRPEHLAGRGGGGGTGNRLRRGLVAAQIAVSLTLLDCAGLLAASLRNLSGAPLGIDPSRVVTASFTLPRQPYAEPARLVGFLEELEERVRRLPGVSAAAVTDSLPPGGDPRSVPYVAMRNPGGDVAAQGMGGNVFWRYVTPGYFSALGIPIVAGRGFLEEDRLGGDPVLVINRALAKRLFADGEAVGKRIPHGVIAGVAGDARNHWIEAGGLAGGPEPEFYVVRKHDPDQTFRNQRPPYGWRRAIVVARTTLDERTAAGLIREEIRKLDAGVPVEVETMRQQVGRFLERPRFNAVLLGLFALAAVALAAIGLFGLMSFLAVQRRREIGVRMALGATPSAVGKLIFGQAMNWTMAGVAAGLCGVFWTSRLLPGLLYGIEGGDPWVAVSAAALLGAIAAAAAWGPSVRAARLDPMATLREE